MTSAEVSPVDREEFYRALKKNDLAKLAQIYADDYVLVRPDRSVLSKTQILDDLKTHSMTFRSKNEKVRIYGATTAAVVHQYTGNRPRAVTSTMSTMGLDCALSQEHNSQVLSVLLGHPRGRS